MRILFVLAALFTLAGCESMDFVAVDYHSGHNYGPYVRSTNHISYTLGYYSGNYYNGYRVYGNHGHRYYHAPRNYSGHRHFSRPVVVHQHVHTTYCEHTLHLAIRHHVEHHLVLHHLAIRHHKCAMIVVVTMIAVIGEKIDKIGNAIRKESANNTKS